MGRAVALGISVLAPWVLVLAGTQWEPLGNSAMLNSDHSVMAHNRHRGEGRDAEPLTGSSTPAKLSRPVQSVSPSILASPRCDALHVHRHAAVFLVHRKLDRLPLSLEAGELLRRNVSAAEGRRRDPDPGNAAGCIAALRLFLLLRRLGQCRVDSFQFVGKVETIEAVVGDRADIGLGDAFRRRGASRQSRSDPQSRYKSRSAAHRPPRTIGVNDVSVACVRNLYTSAAGRGCAFEMIMRPGPRPGRIRSGSTGTRPARFVTH